MSTTLNILFCYSRVPAFTSAVREYVEAFSHFSAHHIHYLDMDSARLPENLTPYDAIIFNYCYWARCLKIDEAMKKTLKHYDGVKVAILQDEYDMVPIHKRTLIDIAVDIVITCVPKRYWREVYVDDYFDNVTFFYALSGYANGSLVNIDNAKPLAQRPVVLGYRAREVPFSYGALTYDKYRIGLEMKKICKERGMVADIEVSESSRIYGDAWAEFIGNCRAMLGSESGSNVYDATGEIKPAIEAYVKAHPEADFATVHALFLQDIEGKICINGVSPRFFEMIAHRTALVLFEGEYADILQPDMHYIPLKKDFSNVDEVVRKLDDIDALEAMVERAYTDIIASERYSFSTFVKHIDALIEHKVKAPKNYIPVWGLIGWKTDQNAPWQSLSQNAQIPMHLPLIDKDRVADPMFQWRINFAAGKRKLLKVYAQILYSQNGQWLKQKLQTYPKLYHVLQAMIRTLMGR